MQITPIHRPGFPMHDSRRRLSAGSIQRRLEEEEKKERNQFREATDMVEINQQPKE